ncbi:hypothetical protein J3F83DRAFT_748490 [Trichoderma novae-zelandiae]
MPWAFHLVAVVVLFELSSFRALSRALLLVATTLASTLPGAQPGKPRLNLVFPLASFWSLFLQRLKDKEEWKKRRENLVNVTRNKCLISARLTIAADGAR